MDKQRVEDTDDPDLESVEMSSKSEKLTWQVILATLLSSAGCFNFGFALGWTAQSNDNIEDDPDMPDFTDNQNNWISAILTLGMVFGSFLGADMCDRFGRQLTLIATGGVSNIGWICVALANDFPLVASGRFIIGISIGMVNTASPAYVAEITPPRYRGLTGGAFQNGVNFGVAVALLISPYLDWRTLSVLGLVSGSVMGIGLMFMKESPVWLLANGKITLFQRSVQFFSGESGSAPGTVQRAQVGNEASTQSTYEKWEGVMKDPQFFKPLFLCNVMALAFQFSAVTVITFYNVQIFTDAGFSDDTANLSSQLLGGFQLIVGVAGSFLSTIWPRKPFFVITSLLTTVGLLGIAVCFLIREEVYDSNLMDYALIASFVYTISVFAFGVGTITWAYIGELLPATAPGVVIGSAVCTNGVSSFFITFYFDQMKDAMGDYGVFFLYAGVYFVCTIILAWGSPETKGFSLTQIQNSFRRKN